MNFLDFVKIKMKLILLAFLPIMVLMFFLFSQIFENYNKKIYNSKTKILISKIDKLANIIHALESERMAYMRITNGNFLDNLTNLISSPNLFDVLVNTKKQFTIFNTAKINNTPLHKFTQEMYHQVVLLRQKIDNELLSTAIIGNEYSKIIHLFLEKINLMSNNSFNHKLNLYVESIKLTESTSHEVASLDDVFLSTQINRDLFSSYLLRYSKHVSLLTGFTNLLDQEKSNSEYLSILKKIEKNNIRKYSLLILSRVDKLNVLSQIKSKIGFGGLIQSYYNYQLYKEQKYKDNFIKQHKEVIGLIHKYKKIKPTISDEKVLLDNVVLLTAKYNKNINLISINNHTIQNIDNKTAVIAIDNLSKKVYGYDFDKWNDSSSEYLKLMRKLEETTHSNLLININETIKNTNIHSRNQLILFLILIMIVSVLIYFINKNIIDKITNFEFKLNNFLRFVKGEDNHIEITEDKGSDEFSLMLQKISADMKYIQKKIKEEKKFIKESKKYFENLKHGNFNEVLLFDGDNKNIKELTLIVNNFDTFFQEIIYEINFTFYELIRGNFKHRMKISCDGDFLVLKESLNDTIGKLDDLTNNLNTKVTNAVKENQKKDQLLAQQSKLAAMGEMVGSIAHQWRQPLNAIGGSIQMVDLDYEDNLINEKYIEDFIQHNMKLINYMSKTIDDFRDFFRVDKTKGNFSIKNVVESTISLIDSQFKCNNINIDIKEKHNIILNGYKSEFQQVILNIINNAKDEFIEKKQTNGDITIEILNDNNIIYIKISDNAGGISEKIINRIFEPYYTTKEQGKGIGLGLYMSKMIIEENMDGKLNVYNSDVGAVFEIVFEVNSDE